MIHNISYRVFVYGTENEEKVKEAVKTLFPNSHPETDTTEGYFKNPVLIHGVLVILGATDLFNKPLAPFVPLAPLAAF